MSKSIAANVGPTGRDAGAAGAAAGRGGAAAAPDGDGGRSRRRHACNGRRRRAPAPVAWPCRSVLVSCDSPGLFRLRDYDVTNTCLKKHLSEYRNNWKSCVVVCQFWKRRKLQNTRYFLGPGPAAHSTPMPVSRHEAAERDGDVGLQQPRFDEHEETETRPAPPERPVKAPRTNIDPMPVSGCQQSNLKATSAS